MKFETIKFETNKVLCMFEAKKKLFRAPLQLTVRREKKTFTVEYNIK